MYGMVNKAVEEFVCLHHGPEVWEKIKEAAGVDVEVFMTNEGYPDEITYQLVGAASKVLDVPADQILIGFGEHWVLHTAQEGYGGLMKAGGDNLADFLRNLPNFHAHVSMIFPKLEPPRFYCTEITENSLKLHYISHREGLASFVIGLMQGLGKMFHTPATVKLLEAKVDGAEHDVFEVTWEPAAAA
jgi:hypothetical protein